MKNWNSFRFDSQSATNCQSTRITYYKTTQITNSSEMDCMSSRQKQKKKQFVNVFCVKIAEWFSEAGISDCIVHCSLKVNLKVSINDNLELILSLDVTQLLSFKTLDIFSISMFTSLSTSHDRNCPLSIFNIKNIDTFHIYTSLTSQTVYTKCVS